MSEGNVNETASAVFAICKCKKRESRVVNIKKIAVKEN